MSRQANEEEEETQNKGRIFLELLGFASGIAANRLPILQLKLICLFRSKSETERYIFGADQ